MLVHESRVREACTDAVFERGRNYRKEGRITRIDRFGTVVTAAVQGSRLYDVSVDLSARDFDPSCTCPYSGAGACKHVVAVLLEVAKNPLTDEHDRIEALLDDISPEQLRSFLEDELARNPGMRDRLRARFGDSANKSVEEYRAEVERLFEERTTDSPVIIEAIDFSRFTDLAAQYRSRGQYRDAATIYRALAEGIEANMHLVDAAYDHYARTFQAALDGYVECIQAADLTEEEYRNHADVLAQRAAEAVDYLADRYVAAHESARSDR